MAKSPSPSTSLTDFAAVAKQALSEFRASLQSIRSEIGALQRDRDRIMTLPVDVKTAHARIDEWVDEMVRASDDQGGMAWYFIHPQHRFERNSPSFFRNFEHKVRRYLARSVGEQMKVDVAADLEGVDTISEAERERQISILDRKIAKLEVDEERMIRSAEAAGLVAPRRANASGMALLAADDDDADIDPDDLTEEDRATLAAFEKQQAAMNAIAARTAKARDDDDGFPAMEMA